MGKQLPHEGTHNLLIHWDLWRKEISVECFQRVLKLLFCWRVFHLFVTVSLACLWKLDLSKSRNQSLPSAWSACWLQEIGDNHNPRLLWDHWKSRIYSIPHFLSQNSQSSYLLWGKILLLVRGSGRILRLRVWTVDGQGNDQLIYCEHYNRTIASFRAQWRQPVKGIWMVQLTEFDNNSIIGWVSREKGVLLLRQLGIHLDHRFG